MTMKEFRTGEFPDQNQKGWHPTAITWSNPAAKILGRRSNQGLALYCHNQSNSTTKFYNEDQSKDWHSTVIIGQILQQKFYGRDQNAGTILPQSWSKFMTEIKPRRWHHTATYQTALPLGPDSQWGKRQCQSCLPVNMTSQHPIQPLNPNRPKSISTGN